MRTVAAWLLLLALTPLHTARGQEAIGPARPAVLTWLDTLPLPDIVGLAPVVVWSSSPSRGRVASSDRTLAFLVSADEDAFEVVEGLVRHRYQAGQVRPGLAAPGFEAQPLFRSAGQPLHPDRMLRQLWSPLTRSSNPPSARVNALVLAHIYWELGAPGAALELLVRQGLLAPTPGIRRVLEEELARALLYQHLACFPDIEPAERRERLRELARAFPEQYELNAAVASLQEQLARDEAWGRGPVALTPEAAGWRRLDLDPREALDDLVEVRVGFRGDPAWGRLLSAGLDAVPVLLAGLSDPRLTRSLRSAPDPRLCLQTVSDVCLALLQAVAGRPLEDAEAAHDWWQATRVSGRVGALVERLSSATVPHEQVRALAQLLELDPRRAVEAGLAALERAEGDRRAPLISILARSDDPRVTEVLRREVGRGGQTTLNAGRALVRRGVADWRALYVSSLARDPKVLDRDAQRLLLQLIAQPDWELPVIEGLHGLYSRLDRTGRTQVVLRATQQLALRPGGDRTAALEALLVEALDDTTEVGSRGQQRQLGRLAAEALAASLGLAPPDAEDAEARRALERRWRALHGRGELLPAAPTPAPETIALARAALVRACDEEAIRRALHGLEVLGPAASLPALAGVLQELPLAHPAWQTAAAHLQALEARAATAARESVGPRVARTARRGAALLPDR